MKNYGNHIDIPMTKKIGCLLNSFAEKEKKWHRILKKTMPPLLDSDRKIRFSGALSDL